MVKFTARTIHVTGRVTYHWSFDDGTASDAQNPPPHTFHKRGWYYVTMLARDAAGHVYQMNLQLHAWRPKDWTRLKDHLDPRIVRHSVVELKRKEAKRAARPAPPPASAPPP